jgi:hypothetical protein
VLAHLDAVVVEELGLRDDGPVALWRIYAGEVERVWTELAGDAGEESVGEAAGDAVDET